MIDVALCIGINAYGHGNDLAGCVNDAQDWARAMQARGATVLTMLDGAATRTGIVNAMTQTIATLRRGQTAVITYSGHGTFLPDVDGDEVDGRDEAICPADLWDAGLITDDALFSIFTARPYGSRLVFVSDSCHSGTVNRLAEPLAPSGAGARLVRFLPPAHFLEGRLLEQAHEAAAVPRGRSRSSALLMSGCADPEYSYDAWFQDAGGQWRANGAFTRVAVDALAGLGEDATFRDWHRAVRGKLPSQDYPQTPGLVGTSAQKRWRVL